MIKLDNYIIEFHRCNMPYGYIIEISKREEIENVGIIRKQYYFYKVSKVMSKARIKRFLIDNVRDIKLRNLLKKHQF